MENCDFIIPKSPTTPKLSMMTGGAGGGSYTNIHHHPSNVGAIDVKQYLSTEEVQELQEIGTQLRLGEVKFNMMYKNRSVIKSYFTL